jgi:Flp pilus assembly protein TadG
MRSWLKQLWHERGGNTAILFGLMIIPIVGFVGLSVDLARAYAVRHQLQNALDAAALAGGRLYNEASRDDQIQAYFDSNLDTTRYGATFSPLSIASNPLTGTLTVSATAVLPTVFSKVLGYDTIDVGADVEIVRNDTTLEVALVIDTTGSMNWNDASGTYKMTAAKDAANLLLNILYNNQDSDTSVHVSVVPFVQNVNVGNVYSSWLASGSEAAIPWNSGPYPDSGGWRGCMDERLDGSGQVIYSETDDPPSVQRFTPHADHYFGPNCPQWTSGEKGILIGICRMNNGSIYSATTSGTSGSTAPTHTTGTASDGAVTWAYRRPSYPTTAGNNPVSCPVWQRGESVTSGACRFAPNCPNWASGESIGIGDCRISNSKIYTATTSGTTSGAVGPSHSSGTSVSGGISWKYRSASYVGVGGNIYVASSSGTTGSDTPVHTGTTAVSDGSVNWTLWKRMWISGQAITATTNNATYRRVNPWYLDYRPTTTGTTSGTAPPTHNTGSATSGSITWSLQTDSTAQVRTASSSQYGIGYNSGCGTPVSPLTDNRLTSKATVDALQPSTGYSGTMTPMGLVWGWRSISPDWRGLWSGVDADRPYDYTKADNYKAVIILTDGDNVFTTCSGTFCRGSGTPYGYLADGRLGTTTGTAAENALDDIVERTCDNIRATGTLIYAVMFDLPSGSSDTRTLFENCVGNPTRFFDAVDASELQAAFQTIAVDLSRLRLSQ